MLVRGVVGNEIENDADATLARFGDQPVECGERAELRIDIAEIGDVVAEIRHRRGIERRNPDGVDLQPAQVIEATPETFEIADAVAVAVLERAQIDLIDDGAAPPFGAGWLRMLCHGRRRRRSGVLRLTSLWKRLTAPSAVRSMQECKLNLVDNRSAISAKRHCHSRHEPPAFLNGGAGSRPPTLRSPPNAARLICTS